MSLFMSTSVTEVEETCNNEGPLYCHIGVDHWSLVKTCMNELLVPGTSVTLVRQATQTLTKTPSHLF